MKKIGTTVGHGILVELTEGEAREFTRLSKAVDGVDWPDYSQPDSYVYCEDFSKTFGAIRAFYEMKFYLNGVRGLLGRFENMFPGKEAKK